MGGEGRGLRAPRRCGAACGRPWGGGAGVECHGGAVGGACAGRRPCAPHRCGQRVGGPSWMNCARITSDQQPWNSRPKAAGSGRSAGAAQRGGAPRACGRARMQRACRCAASRAAVASDWRQLLLEAGAAAWCLCCSGVRCGFGAPTTTCSAGAAAPRAAHRRRICAIAVQTAAAVAWRRFPVTACASRGQRLDHGMKNRRGSGIALRRRKVSPLWSVVYEKQL